jgi:hypothetical protein
MGQSVYWGDTSIQFHSMKAVKESFGVGRHLFTQDCFLIMEQRIVEIFIAIEQCS